MRAFVATWPLLLLAPACVSPSVKTAETAPGPIDLVPAASGPRPAWLDAAPFTETSTSGGLDTMRVYAVGTLEIPVPELGSSCWDAGHAVKTAEHRALAEIAKIELGKPVGEKALTGAISISGWYDGAGKLYVLAAHKSREGSVGSLPKVSIVPSGGSGVQAIASHLRAENKRILEASGACRDPAKRPTLGCCGRPDELCEDPSRFDNRPRPDRCRCGSANPCTYDFACEAGRCVCKGATCPCDVLRCKAGQTCGDGRCY